MRVSRVEAKKNHEKIIEVAAKLFREHGFEGIGVADLMKSAGLTHGGFYGHFESKEDLMAQACVFAQNESLSNLKQAATVDKGDPLLAIASAYLAPTHRDQLGEGCLVAALGADAVRHSPKVRGAFTQGIRVVLEELIGLMPDQMASARQRAQAMYASLIGALILARVVDDVALSDEILQSTLAAVVPRDGASKQR